MMKPSRATTGVATGLALALTLGACARGDIEVEGPLQPSASTQQETAPEEDTGGDAAAGAENTNDADTGDSQQEGGDDEPNDLSAVEPESTGDPFADARTAAQHMPMTGETLASGFAAALDLPGDEHSEAAQLRGEMTALFQEHVYLAGSGIATAYHTGADSDEFELALETLDANSVALAEPVGEFIGEGAQESFLRNWREHNDDIVDYAVAASEGDEASMNQADADLREYTDGVGAFFERNTDGELDSETVTEFFNGHIDTLTTAVDSLAAGETDAFSNLKIAGDHMAEGSAVMAEGLDNFADAEGDPTDEASSLRARLTANLNEHVYLAGIAVFVAYTDAQGTDAEAFEAAAQVLDDNAVELADAVGELAGAQQREPFLQLWRDHIGYFVAYAEAAATDDAAAAENALLELDQYRYEAGEFFDEVSAGELPAEDITEGLGMHVRTLSGAIDSLDQLLIEES